jgi:hypothetical protein
VMGHPRLTLTLTSPVPVAYLSAKLCDVFPDGTSALVSRGVLNLAHRNGHATPLALEPGVPTAIEVELEATSWIFDAGHRVRLSLAGSDWPNVWPPPAAGTLQVERASVELRLPVLEGPGDLPAPTLPPSTGKDAHAAPDVATGDAPVVWRFEHDVIGRETRAVTAYGWNYRADFEAQIEERYGGTVAVSTDDPAAAWAQGEAVYRIEWPEATVHTEARLHVQSDADAYHVVVEILAEEINGQVRHERRFERTIPRRLQ